jgi:hypothetical protein
MSNPTPPKFVGPITLFCWVLGVSDRPFSIDTKNIRTVDHLKDVIVKKKPNVFVNIDADQLNLSMVWSIGVMSFLWTDPSWQLNTSECIQPNATLAEHVQLMVTGLSESAMFISPGEDLSDLFHGKPWKGHLHIIIWSPPASKCLYKLKLCCTESLSTLIFYVWLLRILLHSSHVSASTLIFDKSFSLSLNSTGSPLQFLELLSWSCHFVGSVSLFICTCYCLKFSVTTSVACSPLEPCRFCSVTCFSITLSLVHNLMWFMSPSMLTHCFHLRSNLTWHL